MPTATLLDNGDGGVSGRQRWRCLSLEGRSIGGDRDKERDGTRRSRNAPLARGRSGVVGATTRPFDKRAAVTAHAVAVEGVDPARPVGGSGAEAAATPGAEVVAMPAMSTGAQLPATTWPTVGASTLWRSSSAEPSEGRGRAMRHRPMKMVGDVVWGGTRRLSESPIVEDGRDGARADGREGESKRTRQRMSPLLGRRREETWGEGCSLPW